MKNTKDIGLLILRLGIGIMFLLHGLPKISGGPEMWEKLGGSMSNLGIHFLPVVWGFLAAVAEFFGGVCLIFGVLWIPATLMLLFTMIVAITVHLGNGDGINGASHAIEAAILFLSLLMIGPGKYIVKK